MSFPSITLKSIQAKATSQSFARGDQYYRSGAVEQVIQRGMTLQARVEGSEPIDYQVTIPFDTGGILSARCSCPYSLEGWCKHIVATLLVCSHHPDRIQVRPSLDQLLDRLDLNQTRQTIRNLLNDRPELIEAFDFQVNSLVSIAPTKAKTSSPAKKVRQTAIDSNVYRRQVHSILRGAVRDLENGREEDSVSDEIGEILEKVNAFSAAGDGESSIAILEGITQGCVDEWEEVDDYGIENHEVVEMLDKAWAEAILTAELTDEEEDELRSKLETWQDEWSCEFPIGLEALRQGWNYAPLVEVLKGETELRAWEDEIPDCAPKLAMIRLTILNRQERFEEYLYLAEAEKQFLQYWLMLVKVGRIEDSVDSAKLQMTHSEDAYTLAKSLRTAGAIEEALEIANLGLTFPINRYSDFTEWTSDLAEGLNKPEFALQARLTAFQTRPSFADYLKIQDLAGEHWTELRQDLLNSLESEPKWYSRDVEASVDILLHEGLFDRAIDTVKNISSYSYQIIHRVMDAVIPHKPNWVITNANRYAEEIMDSGKAKNYDYAVNWLKRSKAAYIAADRQAEWKNYYQNIRTVHGRKRKLMELLGRL